MATSSVLVKEKVELLPHKQECISSLIVLEKLFMWERQRICANAYRRTLIRLP